MQQTLATYLVDQVYANVDVAAQLRAALPPRAQPLAAPPPPVCTTARSGSRSASSHGLACTRLGAPRTRRPINRSSGCSTTRAASCARTAERSRSICGRSCSRSSDGSASPTASRKAPPECREDRAAALQPALRRADRRPGPARRRDLIVIVVILIFAARRLDRARSPAGDPRVRDRPDRGRPRAHLHPARLGDQLLDKAGGRRRSPPCGAPGLVDRHRAARARDRDRSSSWA